MLRITVEIDDDEIRRLLAPLAQHPPAPQAQTMTRLLNVKEVADRLGVSRNKVYELLYKGEIHSLAVGRTRRISPAALAEFISRPRENALDYTPAPPRAEPERSTSYRRSARTTGPRVEQPKARRPKPGAVIDLSPKPLPPGSRDLNISSEEFERALASMVEKGWPADVVDQIRADRKDGVNRVNLLTINDAAKYLGLSRYGGREIGQGRQTTPTHDRAHVSRPEAGNAYSSQRHSGSHLGHLRARAAACCCCWLSGLRSRFRIRDSQNRGDAREHYGVGDLRWEALRYTLENQPRCGFAYLLGLSLGPAAGASVILRHRHHVIACTCHRRQRLRVWPNAR